jgi:hypothetical protein
VRACRRHSIARCRGDRRPGLQNGGDADARRDISARRLTSRSIFQSAYEYEYTPAFAIISKAWSSSTTLLASQPEKLTLSLPSRTQPTLRTTFGLTLNNGEISGVF